MINYNDNAQWDELPDMNQEDRPNEMRHLVQGLSFHG